MWRVRGTVTGLELNVSQINVRCIICVLCLWFRALLIYINNCPTRCNTKQTIYYSASSLYTFQVSTTPITKSTQNCNYSLRYWSTWPRWREVAAQKIWPVPEAVVTVLCTPDGGCGWHPKHVEWTCRIINSLLCVASRWTTINKVRCITFQLNWFGSAGLTDA